MEHSVLEQLQGDDNPAISTIKIFNLHNQAQGKFFLANAGNFASVWAQFNGYTSSSPNGSDHLSQFQTAVNAGATLILPQNGQVALNDWTGAGYVDYRVSGSQRSLGMIIGGGLNGGFASLAGTVNAITQSSLSRPAYTPPANIATPKGVDPVDLGSGAYLNAGTDLALGGGGPRGLRFGRSYNSQQVNANRAFMAPGWSHSYAIELNRFSDLDAALGLRTPQDAAALIVAAYVARDLLNDTQPALKNWMTAALVTQWATDQLLDKAVAVNLGDRVLSYRQQPDGSYTPPPGVTTDLSQNPNGTYQLQERFGTVLAFNTDNRIQSLTDIDGNALSFIYSNGRLSQVEDAYNRTLTLTYTGDRLTQVSDNQGRSVHYDYTGDDLTGYRDAENKLWQYGYDDHHQILTVTDPVNAVIVDNSYDASGKVIRQTAPRDNNTTAVYTLHYTGLSSSEEDPLGHRTTYTYDFAGRTVAVENALGEKSEVDYDGQGQVITQTDPLGRISSHSYDSHNNLRVSRNPLDEPTEFQYDGQHRLTRVIDVLGHGAEIDYDAKHRPIRFRNGETDASTGRRLQTLRRYYANGLLQLEADARQTRTDYVYDAFGWLDTQPPCVRLVVDMVVKKVVLKIVSMFIPGAGFISAILSIYDLVMVVVQKLSKIAQVGAAFIGSIVQIAAGNIGGAAKRVESVLAGMLLLAISFLAGFAGLGKVADKVMGVINKVRVPIDKALDKLIGWIVGRAKALFSKLFGKKDDKRTENEKKQDLESAIRESEILLDNPKISTKRLDKKLISIKKKYKLTSLTLVKASENQDSETSYVSGEINPKLNSRKVSKPKSSGPLVASVKVTSKGVSKDVQERLAPAEHDWAEYERGAMQNVVLGELIPEWEERTGAPITTSDPKLESAQYMARFKTQKAFRVGSRRPRPEGRVEIKQPGGKGKILHVFAVEVTTIRDLTDTSGETGGPVRHKLAQIPNTIETLISKYGPGPEIEYTIICPRDLKPDEQSLLESLVNRPDAKNLKIVWVKTGA